VNETALLDAGQTGQYYPLTFGWLWLLQAEMSIRTNHTVFSSVVTPCVRSQVQQWDRWLWMD